MEYGMKSRPKNRRNPSEGMKEIAREREKPKRTDFRQGTSTREAR